MTERRIVALDLETTGLEPETARIVEMCFITLDDDLEELDRWTERVNPGIPIPPETTAIHGIRDEDVADLPGFDDFADRVRELLDGAILMAYNHGYDMNVLHYELERHGRPGVQMDHPVIDPLAIFREHYPHSLAGAVKQYIGEDLQDAHTAEGDTDAMVRVLRAQITRHDLSPKGSENLVHRRRTYLDRARRFYEEDGVTRFGFGKYRHEPVGEHVDYLQWMLAKDFPEDTKNIAKHLVDAHIERAPGSRTMNSAASVDFKWIERQPDGSWTFKRGKHAGQSVKENRDYCVWLLSQELPDSAAVDTIRSSQELRTMANAIGAKTPEQIAKLLADVSTKKSQIEQYERDRNWLGQRSSNFIADRK